MNERKVLLELMVYLKQKTEELSTWEKMHDTQNLAVLRAISGVSVELEILMAKHGITQHEK